MGVVVVTVMVKRRRDCPTSFYPHVVIGERGFKVDRFPSRSREEHVERSGRCGRLPAVP
jgi:hypothetical protein